MGWRSVGADIVVILALGRGEGHPSKVVERRTFRTIPAARGRAYSRRMRLVSLLSVAQGLAAMTVNPLRTALSTLGVVMGIASVIATLALADGLERYVRTQLAASTDVQAITVSSKTQEIRDGFAFPNRRYPIFGLR